MKFYIVKRDEREGDGYTAVMEFETVSDLQRYINYNVGYIEEMKTLDEVDRYMFEDVQGNRVQG